MSGGFSRPLAAHGECIAVLGAGPAGVMAALGLHRLGYPVQVISQWRRFDAIEGVSARVMQALAQQGLTHTLSMAVPAAEREVHWGEAPVVRNREFLIDRPQFDAALRADLAAGGVPLREARVRQLHPLDAGWDIELDDGSRIAASRVVDARGRQAPQSGAAQRGPETVSLLCRWRATPGAAASAVERRDDGWTWLARLPDGTCYWQWVTGAQLPGRAELPAWCAAARQASALARRFFPEDPGAAVTVHARSSTSTLSEEGFDSRLLRVGDAAMAVDPLSGNGIFQSLSSALQAPAVLHTLIRDPSREVLALDFHRERVRHLFLRFARMGRDFYRQAPAVGGFWPPRQHWPDEAPLHYDPDPSQLRVAERPVLEHGEVVARQVVVTADQPLGVWHVDGVALAPLVAALPQQSLRQLLTERVPQASWQAVGQWFLSQGVPLD